MKKREPKKGFWEKVKTGLLYSIIGASTLGYGYKMYQAYNDPIYNLNKNPLKESIQLVDEARSNSCQALGTLQDRTESSGGSFLVFPAGDGMSQRIVSDPLETRKIPADVNEAGDYLRKAINILDSKVLYEKLPTLKQKELRYYQNELKNIQKSLPKQTEKIPDAEFKKIIEKNYEEVYKIVRGLNEERESLKKIGARQTLEETVETMPSHSLTPVIIWGLLSLIFISVKFTGFSIINEISFAVNFLGIVFFFLFIANLYLHTIIRKMKIKKD